MRLQREFFLKPTLKVAQELLGKYLVRNYKGKLIIGKIVETEAYIGPKDKASHAYAQKEQPFKERIKVIKQNWERIKNYLDDPDKFIKKILKLKNAKVTKRNLAEYLRGGHIYIYLVYGMYYQFNITTYKEGYPECVLIRSLEPITRTNANYTRTNADKNNLPGFSPDTIPGYKPDISGNHPGKNIKTLRESASSLRKSAFVPNGPGKLCQYLKLDSSFWGEDICKSKKIWLMNGEKIDKNDIIRAKRIGIDYAGEDANLLWRFYIKNNQWVSKK
jgi:DNA-3-methyladenine glycosylase